MPPARESVYKTMFNIQSESTYPLNPIHHKVTTTLTADLSDRPQVIAVTTRELDKAYGHYACPPVHHPLYVLDVNSAVPFRHKLESHPLLPER